jgi:hypothetical protein
VVCAALAAPWVAYQTLVDPPAGRLIREHLGDGRAGGSAVEAVIRANVERPLAEHVRIRLANLASQIGRPAAAIWPHSIADGQGQQFFRHGASLGVLIIGLIAVLAGWGEGSQPGGRTVRTLAWTAVVAVGAWSLLVFGPDQARIHHGSPVSTILLFVAGAAGLARLPPVIRLGLLLAHAAAWFVLWYLPFWAGPWLSASR